MCDPRQRTAAFHNITPPGTLRGAFYDVRLDTDSGKTRGWGYTESVLEQDLPPRLQQVFEHLPSGTSPVVWLQGADGAAAGGAAPAVGNAAAMLGVSAAGITKGDIEKGADAALFGPDGTYTARLAQIAALFPLTVGLWTRTGYSRFRYI